MQDQGKFKLGLFSAFAAGLLFGPESEMSA
jgi:hypothetical protein